jgi:hypothetical protein
MFPGESSASQQRDREGEVCNAFHGENCGKVGNF